MAAAAVLLLLALGLPGLVKLPEAGLLEPDILFARADEGISQDYRAYLNSNRDKLRQCVLQFVIHPQH